MALRTDTSHSTPNVNGGTTTEQKPDAIVVIMGMTGSGKSSFIKLLTGDEEIEIGHGVSSQTSKIGVHCFSASDGRRVALVDTPGFDDSNGMTDSDVLDEIASFLKDTYGKINGLIYCQRIDVRAGGLTIRNLRMFEKVCGLALKNAAIVTTRWDMVGDNRAIELEQELVTGERYFAPLCRAGAVTFGHNNTPASARRVMYKILNNTPIVLQIQEELAKPGATLEQTAAGSQLSTDLDAMIKRHEKEMKKLREEIADAIKAKDKDLQIELDDELAKRKDEVERSQASKEQLKKPPYVPL
ncbi:P-loop containing nucleoside triphosphate hydrolase protein [Russula brevipes]|nr:P-loop containing nucleoside triphosphate hydrolase protein [Russula brevipes]